MAPLRHIEVLLQKAQLPLSRSSVSQPMKQVTLEDFRLLIVCECLAGALLGHERPNPLKVCVLVVGADGRNEHRGHQRAMSQTIFDTQCLWRVTIGLLLDQEAGN